TSFTLLHPSPTLFRSRSSMAKSGRTYTPAFKAEAVKLVTQQGYSVAKAARSLGVHETVLRSWKQALQAKGDQAAASGGNPALSRSEGTRLNSSHLVIS